MEEFKFLKQVVTFTLGSFGAFALIGLLLSIKNLILLSKDDIANNYGGLVREVICMYLEDVSPSSIYFNAIFAIIISYAIFYYVTVKIFFNEESKIMKYLSKKITFFSKFMVLEEDRHICNRLTSIIVVIMILSGIGFIFFAPIVFIINTLFVLAIIYYIPYKIFVILFIFAVLSNISGIYIIFSSDILISKLKKNGITKKIEMEFLGDKRLTEFFDRVNYDEIYLLKETEDFFVGAFAMKATTESIIVLGSIFSELPKYRYAVIHEYGHLHYNHTRKKMRTLMFSEFIVFGLSFLLILSMLYKSKYHNFNKKLCFFIWIFLLPSTFNITIVQVLKNVFSQIGEYEADNFATKNGFGYETTILLKDMCIDFSKVIMDNPYISTIHNYFLSTHPTNFKRILTIAEDLRSLQR